MDGGSVRLEKTGLVCEHDRLHAVTQVELLEDVRDVGLHRRLADVELAADLGVRLAAGDQPEHVHLALGQSYPETGGTNQSALHWDLIVDLRETGRVMADGRVVMEQGTWLVG